jgi:hypothetical protein
MAARSNPSPNPLKLKAELIYESAPRFMLVEI